MIPQPERLFKELRAVRQALNKRSQRSQRSEDKQDKEVEEDIGPTMAQNRSNMVPKWSQNDPKMATSWSQDGPKMPQEGHKKQQKHENEKYEAPRDEPRKINSPLGTHVGAQVDPFWTKFGDFLSTCLRRGFFIDF